MMDDRDETQAYADSRCSCGHPKLNHRKTGACMYGLCMCGWRKNEQGQLVEKATGVCHGAKKKGRWKKQWQKAMYGKPCYFCGKQAQTVDHLTARSRGGRNTKNNLVSACHRCNNMKGSKSYDEFIEHCERLMWSEYDRDKGKEVKVIQFPVKIPA